MKKFSIQLFALAIIATAWFSQAQAGPLPVTRSAPAGLTKLEQLPSLTTPSADNAALLAEHPFTSSAPVMRFAERMPVDSTPFNSGKWEQLTSAEGDPLYVWRLVVHSPTAVSINLEFSKFRLPAGAELFIYSPDNTQMIGPFTQSDNDEHGQLWTPIIRGNTVVIELNIPRAQIDDFELELGSVNHGFRSIGKDKDSATGDKTLTEPAYKSGACNADVVCPEVAPWRAQSRSVAIYVIGGTTVCSAAALNNTHNDQRPYLITAEHCGITAANAASMVVFWNYQNSVCRTPGTPDSANIGDGDLNQFNSGAILRASYPDSDMTLVELDDPIDPAYRVFFAGWDRRANLPTSAASIHHPSGEEKRVSLDNDPVTATGEFVDYPGAGTHLRVAAWELGDTEPGSSGAPLFDQNKRIVGQLTGGASACGNYQPDWFGRLYRSWDGGGTDDSRLRNWLDPDNSGVPYIDGLNPPSTGILPIIYSLLLQ